VLSGTPYLLEGELAASVARELEALDARVNLLRSRGTLDQGTLDRLREEWRVEQVYETVGIEGNQLDLNETRLVLARGVTISGKPTRDAEEVVNMRAALDFLEKLARSDEPLRATDLRQIHALVMGDGAGAGEYRTGDIEISGARHKPPPAPALGAQVDQLLSWLQRSQTPPVLAATVAHAWLVHIHPFRDGNGRTARALMNLVLIRAGYPIVLMRRKDRPRYYDALAESDDGDIAPLLDLVLTRSGDSLRQISRIRAAETGLTEAVLRAEQHALKIYEAWRYAMLLLIAELDREAHLVRERSRSSIDVHIRQYDQVTPGDFLALLQRDASGNGWLAVLRGTSPGRQRAELLLWVGFRSPEMSRLGRISDSGASVFFSEPDPSRVHPFKQVASESAFTLREISFEGDRFIVRERKGGNDAILHLGATELAARTVRDFIDVFVAPAPADFDVQTASR
jgi:Fic family protein